MAGSSSVDARGGWVEALLAPAGRINRRTYAVVGIPSLAAVGVSGTLLAIRALDLLLDDAGSIGPGWMAPPLLAVLAVSLFIWIVTSIKRLHDIGVSGLVLLFMLTPLAGPAFLLIVCLVTPGDSAENAYGAAPRPRLGL